MATVQEDPVQARIDADRAYLRDAENQMNSDIAANRAQREAPQPNEGRHRQPDWNPLKPNSDMPQP